jgi:hypothetical protein
MAFTKYVNKKMVLKRFKVGGSMFKVGGSMFKVEENGKS